MGDIVRHYVWGLAINVASNAPKKVGHGLFSKCWGQSGKLNLLRATYVLPVSRGYVCAVVGRLRCVLCGTRSPKHSRKKNLVPKVDPLAAFRSQHENTA